MRQGLMLVVAVMVAASVPTLAHCVDPADPIEPLNTLAWTIGGKWVAETKGADDSPLGVEVTFQWASHRKAINYAIVIKSKDKTIPQYEGTYFWHPGKKQVALLQLDALGNVTESTLTADGMVLKQENVLTSEDGSKHEQRVEIVREGDDAFQFNAFVPKEGKWVKAVTFQYKRVR
jgi:hypothetical protein